MKAYQIKIYDEALEVIQELGLLPLAPLFPDYPSLASITKKEEWHTGTEYDPWSWRTKFAADGEAAYGKILRKKSMFISRGMVSLFRNVLGSSQTIKDLYFGGSLSKEGFEMYTLIEQEEGIDTRILRAKAGMKEKEKKKAFDHGLLELQGNMSIVVSGTKEKQDANGEKNGWSSTSYETMRHWAEKNKIEDVQMSREEAKEELIQHFSKMCSAESLKKLKNIFA